MADTKPFSEITFGRCTRCGEHVSGHAVYVDGVLFCGYCELDTYFMRLEEIMNGISG